MHPFLPGQKLFNHLWLIFEIIRRRVVSCDLFYKFIRPQVS